MKRDEELVDYLLKTARVEPLQIVCGVYFLFEGEEIVYVGQSTDVLVRVRTHYKDQGKKFDKWAYIEVPEDDLLAMERLYIDMFQPYLNTAGIKFYGTRRRHNRRRHGKRFIVHESGLQESIEVTDAERREAAEALDRLLHTKCTPAIAGGNPTVSKFPSKWSVDE